MTHATPQTPPEPHPGTERLPPGIERLPSGRFRVKQRDPETRNGWMPGGNFATVEEAQQYRRGLLAILSRASLEGTQKEPDSLQVFGDAWLDELEVVGHSPTIETFRSQWAQHIADTPLSRLAVTRITTLDVRTWVEVVAKKAALVPVAGGETTHAPSPRRISRDTVSKVLSMLRTLFERAVEKGTIAVNPARGVRAPKSATRPRADDVWTHLSLAEIDRLQRCTEIPENYRTIYLFAIYTGLREGELWGLHWADVHDGDGELHPHVVVRFSRRGPPKNKRIRHVPLLAPARELLRRWRQIAPKSEEGLVFPTRTGSMRAKGDDARWADYHTAKMVEGVRTNVRCEGQSKKLKLGRPARFHDLRHTCASKLIEGAWGPQWTLSEIAAWLGHTDTEVTERYAHLSPDHLHAKAAQTALRGTAPVFHAPPADSPKPLARPRGLEPLASRSVVEGQPQWFREVTPQRGTPVEHARAVLRAVAQTGRVSEATIQALAAAVLTTTPVQLALELQASAHTPRAPHRLRRALELAAAVVLEWDSTECADSADSADSVSANGLAGREK